MKTKPNLITRALSSCLAMVAAAIVLSGVVQAHTTQICYEDVGGVTTFYAGTYHDPSEGPSPVGGIIIDGFTYPFSGWISPAQLPAGVTCVDSIPGTGYGTPPAVVHYQTFTAAFSPGEHTVSFTATNDVQSPWGVFPTLNFGSAGCADADFDGICNDVDPCPLDATNDADRDGVCGDVDNCPLVANPSQVDANDNGQGDACEGDVCGNGLVTGAEQCDDGNIAGGDGCSALCSLEIADIDGDGISDDLDICQGGDDNLDADTDGVPDFCDPCPLDAGNDSDGDGSCDSSDLCNGNDSSGDYDGDGLCDDIDPCIGSSNNDNDHDGICDEGDVCLGNDATGDTDGDGVCDDLDACNGDDASGDTDSDGVCDDLDACPRDASNDSDGDGLCADVDNCPNTSNSDQADLDQDQLGDLCDADIDGDMVPNEDDNCVFDGNSDQADFDADGAGDVCDADDDNDGVIDSVDACLVALGDTPDTSVVDASGCSIADSCPCDNDWKNHGAYVRCVAHTSEDFVEAGLITEEEKDLVVSTAGQSDCGSKKR